MRKLAESFCTQLQTPDLMPQLADQVSRDLDTSFCLMMNICDI